VGFSLFWRTFFFLALLLFGSIVAWLQTFRALESEPRAIQSAQQMASLVNLSRAALRYSDSIARVSLIKTLADEERVRITPREPKDKFELFESDELGERTAEELKSLAGQRAPSWPAASTARKACGWVLPSTAIRTGCSPTRPRLGRRATAPGSSG
jgi:hypothetical protein